MKAKHLFFPIYLPLVIGGKIVEFVIWEILSDGRWKGYQVKGSTSLHWQNEALRAQSKLRDLDADYRRKLDEQEQEFRKKLLKTSKAYVETYARFIALECA